MDSNVNVVYSASTNSIKEYSLDDIINRYAYFNTEIELLGLQNSFVFIFIT